jgi:putative ABC transport system permease protein
MTGVIKISMTAVTLIHYPQDYAMVPFSCILGLIGAQRTMKHFRPRWRKVLRDLLTNKTRTALVVLSLAVGLFTVSFLINTESLLRSAFDREYSDVKPSSATLIIPEGFDGDFVEKIRSMPGMEEAEGRRTINVRLYVGEDRWINLNLLAIDDFNDLRIDKVQPISGAWPPDKGSILLEGSSFSMATMPDLGAGDILTIQMANGEETSLKLDGIVYDFNRTPAVGTGFAYGFITIDTLARLGEPAEFNDLRFIVAQNKLDREYIRQVADQVKETVENSGRSVGAISVPEPGQHPLGTILDSLIIILGTLSILTLIGGALLVFNTIVALISQQVRQIGMMKAVGANGVQIAAMYLVMALIIGFLALAITTPIAIWSGIQAGRFLADFFNLDLTTVEIPALAFIAEALIGLAVPFLAALYPVWSGTRVTVREALADYGLANTVTTSSMDRFFKRLRGPLFRRPVLLSLRNTFRRRARLILTLLPLVLSGAILLTVINVRAALVAEVTEIFSYKHYGVNVSFENPYRLAKLENVALRVIGVTSVEGYRETWDAYRLRADGSQSDNISLLALSPTTQVVDLPILAGRWLASEDQRAIVINDAFLRDEPDIRVGDSVLFKINGQKLSLQVAGIVEENMAPPRIYMNLAFFANMAGGVGRASDLWVQTTSEIPTENLKRDLEAQFEQAGLSVLSLKTTGDERSMVEFHFNIMVIPLGLAALMLALVSGLGLAGTMTTNVMERSREVGVMRAIGASDVGIQQIFMIEGLFIGLISWLISMAAALPLTYGLDAMVGNKFLYAPLPYIFSMGGALIWLLIVLVTAALSCYFPAQNASQTSVRELLAYE